LKGSIVTIYLYKKTHKNTGLQYLGQTSKKDPHKYPGSGTYWLKHLDKHGYNYTTEILKECQTKEEVKYWGKHFSKLWNVVYDTSWANLKSEEGNGGKTIGMTGKTHSDETRKKMSDAHKGKIPSNETRKKMADWQIGRKRPDLVGREVSVETRKKLSDAQKGKTKGPMPQEQKDKLSNSLKGRVLSEETKKKMSEARKLLWQKKKLQVV